MVKMFPEKIESNYQVHHLVGQGGLGSVFSATARDSGQQVAIKILNHNVQTDESFIGMFQKEMMLMMNLQHPNLTRFIDCSFDPNGCYVVTEFISGWSLKDLLKFFGRLPPLVACSIEFQILAALDYLHLKDLVHADLSSANIMIEKDGRVVVTDLGLASDLQGHGYRGEMVGTPGYYSPEHVSEDALCNQSDLYSAGLLFYEMVTGKRAIYYGRSIDCLKEILASMKQIDNSKITSTDRNLTNSLRTIIGKMLQYKRSQRTKSTEEVGVELRRCLIAFGIRDVQGAVRQFLEDGCMVTAGPTPNVINQDIYLGNAPYTIDDLAILKRSG